NRHMALHNGNASSVTPSAKNLYVLSGALIKRMIAKGYVEQLMKEKVDLKLLQEAPWQAPFQDFYRGILDHMNPDVEAAFEYFRGKMPFKVDGRLLALYSAYHLRKVLPENLGDPNNALRGLDDFGDPDRYRKVIDALQEKLSSDPTDKK